MTRTPANAPSLAALGASPVVCDVFDVGQLRDAVVAAEPDLVLDELTDLPDQHDRLPELGGRNIRMRTEGIDNLLAAMRAAGAERIVAQSIAWQVGEAGAAAVEHLEQAVLAMRGVVLRYGQLYGPGTYFPDHLPDEPRVSLDRAATRTVDALDLPSGIYTVTD